jgi:hypothetical protein
VQARRTAQPNVPPGRDRVLPPAGRMRPLDLSTQMSGEQPRATLAPRPDAAPRDDPLFQPLARVT